MDFHVLTTHTRDGDDGTPLQFISGAQLKHYQAIERAYAELCAAAQVVALLLPGGSVDS